MLLLNGHPVGGLALARSRCISTAPAAQNSAAPLKAASDGKFAPGRRRGRKLQVQAPMLPWPAQRVDMPTASGGQPLQQPRKPRLTPARREIGVCSNLACTQCAAACQCGQRGVRVGRQARQRTSTCRVVADVAALGNGAQCGGVAQRGGCSQ